MAEFDYIALDKSGKKHKGKITATTREQAILDLKSKGMYTKQLKEFKKSILQMDIQLTRPVKPKEIVIFCRQLSTLIRAGVTIVESVRILTDQTKNRYFKSALQEIVTEMRKGIQLSAASQQHNKIFPPIFYNMVRAGEISGNLDEILERLAIFFEKEYNTVEKVKSALAYPITVGSIAILVTAILLTTVVPKFIGIYTGLGVELPVPTKIVLGISNFLVNYWYIVLLGMLGLILGFISYRKTPEGRYSFDFIKLKIPVFGTLLQKSAIARFARTMSSLFSSAVPLLQSLSIVSTIVGNTVMVKVLEESKENLRKGEKMSEPMKESWAFPPLVSQMIAIGEETGSLDMMLDKIADFYEADVETMVDRLKSLIEPFMIVFLTIIVGTIVLAILLPSFGLLTQIGQ